MGKSGGWWLPNGCRLAAKLSGDHWLFSFSLFASYHWDRHLALVDRMLRQDLRGARRTVPMNIGNDAVNVWIANFSASCRACLYSSAAEHWSRKPGVRSSILLGGCLPFFLFFFFAFRFTLLLSRFYNLSLNSVWKDTGLRMSMTYCLERSSLIFWH